MDENTYKSWEPLHLAEGENLPLQSYVLSKQGMNTMQLTEEKKCPFLDGQKLCKLVTQFGEEVLSKTCTTFPREVHTFSERTEYALVACCPEVVDMLKGQEKICFTESLAREDDDILFHIRAFLIDLVQTAEYSISKSMMILFYILLELQEKKRLTRQDVSLYESKEALQQLSDAIENMEFSSLNTMDENNELFLDLAENYRKEGLYAEFLEKIAAEAEALSEGYDEEELLETIELFEEEFATYEPLFRNYLAAEFFNNSLMPGTDLTDMIIKVQWISLEYTIMKHVIFLEWYGDGKKELSYEAVRNAIVIISRMTGYEDEDICEYLENSFQSVIWDWGYLALLMGNK